MAAKPTPVSHGEVLGPALTKDETVKIERKAHGLYDQAQRTTVQFAAELRRLQEGEAHRIRGFANFGDYAAATFDGLGSVNAQAISRQGRVLIVLEKHGRISLEGKGEHLPGTTAVRALAKTLKDLGEDAMLQIYDKAEYFMLEQKREKLTDDLVLAAVRELIAPPVHELGEGALEPPEDEDEDEDEVIDPIQQQMIDRIRDLSYELPDGVDELQEETERLRRFLTGNTSPEDTAWLESAR